VLLPGIFFHESIKTRQEMIMELFRKKEKEVCLISEKDSISPI
jgi:hypothetical protein